MKEFIEDIAYRNGVTIIIEEVEYPHANALWCEVHVDEIETLRGGLIALHEIGHIVLGHRPWESSLVENMIANELEVWLWTIQKMPFWDSRCQKVLKEGLATYLFHCKIKYTPHVLKARLLYEREYNLLE